MKKVLFVIVVITINILVITNSLLAKTLQLSENRSIQYRGTFENNFWYFVSEGDYGKQPDIVNTISGKIDLVYQSERPFEIKFNPRFVYDSEDDNRNRLLIDDLYVDYFKDLYEVRGGIQIFSWKTVESISHADFLNQKDFELYFLDPDKLGEPAVRVRSIIPLEKEHVLEFYLLPYFTPTKFPVEKNRFSFINSITKTPIDINNDNSKFLYDSSNERSEVQGAIRYQSTFMDDFDFSLFYFYGYRRFPVLIFDPNVSSLNHFYPIVHRGGLTFQGIVENWLLKGEMVYNKFKKEIINQYSNKITPSYFVYTTGFEYTFYSAIVQNHDIGTIFEIIGDSDSSVGKEELEGFRPFKNHIFGGLRYTFNNVTDRAFLFGGIINYKEHETSLQLQYDERIFNSITLHIDYGFLSVNDDSELKPFEKTNKAEIKINYNY